MTRKNRKVTIPVSIGYGLTDIMGRRRIYRTLAHGCFSSIPRLVGLVAD